MIITGISILADAPPPEEVIKRGVTFLETSADIYLARNLTTPSSGKATTHVDLLLLLLLVVAPSLPPMIPRLALFALLLALVAEGRRRPGSRELEPGMTEAVLFALDRSPHIPVEWKQVAEAASPFATNGLARVALWTRFDAQLRLRSGLSGTVPGRHACHLWATAAVDALLFLSGYSDYTGIPSNAPYGQVGVTRAAAEQGYRAACDAMPAAAPTPLCECTG